MTDTVQISFRCDPELRQRLKVAAAEQGVTLNVALEQAAEQWLATVRAGLPVLGDALIVRWDTSNEG